MSGLESIEEADLWRRVLQGDFAAFRIWHEHYDPRLMVFLRNRCFPPLDAADVAQAAWLKIWAVRAQWNPQEGRFVAWMFQLADNVRIDLLRKMRRRPEQPLTEATDAAARPKEERPELRPLQDCLKELGGPYVEVLRLRVNEGLSDAEIAARLEISLGTVSSRVSRGKTEVRQCVERKLA